MIKEFDPRSSLEDIAAQIPAVEELVCVGDVPLIENRVVMEWLEAANRRSGSAAARWMTAWRGNGESRDFQNADEVRRSLVGLVALDLTLREYDESGSIDAAKRANINFQKQEVVEVGISDFGSRLDRSSVERSKEFAAQTPFGRVALPFAIEAGANVAVYQAMMASSSHLDLSLAERGGVFGLTIFAVRVAADSIKRNGPTRLSMAAKNFTTASLGPYIPSEQGKESGGEAEALRLDCHKVYARRHLKPALDAMGSASQDYIVTSRSDIESLVQHVSDVGRDAMYESYGIDPQRNRKPLRDRVLGRFVFSTYSLSENS